MPPLSGDSGTIVDLGRGWIVTIRIRCLLFEIYERILASKGILIPKRLVQLVSEVRDGRGDGGVFSWTNEN